MHTVWLKGYKKEEQEARRKEVMNFRNAFESLVEVLEKEYPEEYKPDYSLAGWEGHLAHSVGQREAFRKIKSILKLGD